MADSTLVIKLDREQLDAINAKIAEVAAATIAAVNSIQDAAGIQDGTDYC